MISITEAHRRWGDLARIRNGYTHWIDVVTEQGTWRPVFAGEFIIIGYALEPRP